MPPQRPPTLMNQQQLIQQTPNENITKIQQQYEASVVNHRNTMSPNVLQNQQMPKRVKEVRNTEGSVVSAQSASPKRINSVPQQDLVGAAPNKVQRGPPQFVPAPNMEDALKQYEAARKQAQRRVKQDGSRTTRLINAMADITVVLLTRAMTEGVNEKIEVRFYKKPYSLPNGSYAVAEYRNAMKPKTSKPEKKDGEQDNDYVVLLAEELMPGDCGIEQDNVENWKEFFGIVQSWHRWLRYCMAVHKRIGWKTNIEKKSFLNMVDSRILGFVTVTIANFV